MTIAVPSEIIAAAIVVNYWHVPVHTVVWLALVSLHFSLELVFITHLFTRLTSNVTFSLRSHVVP